MGRIKNFYFKLLEKAVGKIKYDIFGISETKMVSEKVTKCINI